MNIRQLPQNRFGIVQEQPDGRLVQFAMTELQTSMLSEFLVSLSQTKPLVKLSEKYDLVPKSKVKKMMKWWGQLKYFVLINTAKLWEKILLFIRQALKMENAI